MSQTPLQVLTRPFAIEPITQTMLPDGIFDNAIYRLDIACHYTNTSAKDLYNVTLYLESAGDPGIVFVAQTHHFARIPAGGSVQLRWLADFRNAQPGKRLLSFVAKADGFSSHRSIQQIFVSQTRYDPVAKHYTCSIEEGVLKVSHLSAIGPDWRGQVQREGDKCRCGPDFGPYVPTGMTLLWEPSPAYAGVHGDLPFADPWWKILAIIVAIIAAIVAIVAAATGGGTASFGASGTFDETEPSVHCCSPDVGAGPKRDYTVAGVASAIATGAALVALSDAADPFWRGQEATPPGPGEITLAEKVVARWKLPQAPNAGVAYTADVEWVYTRITDKQQYTFSVSETQTNVHTAGQIKITTPKEVKAFGDLWVQAQIERANGTLYSGTDLYAFALLRAPQGLHFVVPLTDDGLGYDPQANDGLYAGSLGLEKAYRQLLQLQQDVLGVWRVYVFAQDVNKTAPGTPPHIAAQHIGGCFVASAIEITFDPTLPCPLKAQSSITVV
jgi:hypothetical protein